MKIPKEMLDLDFDEFVAYLSSKFNDNDEIKEGLESYHEYKKERHIERINKLEESTRIIEEMNETGIIDLEKLDEVEEMLKLNYYEVTIEFNKSSKVNVREFFEAQLHEHQLLSIKKNFIKVLWRIDSNFEDGDIDVQLHRILKNGKLGKYVVKSF